MPSRSLASDNGAAFVHREQKRQRLHEMRGDSLENAAFAASLEDESEVALRQVPEAAMNELRRPAGRAAGEVRLFDQRHAQTAQRGIPATPAPKMPPPMTNTSNSRSASAVRSRFMVKSPHF